MELDIYSLLAGIVIGAAIAFLTKLSTLKTLSLKLDKIGIGLGVEGFPEDKPNPGVTIGDVNGTTGDIAGGNIDKSSRVDKSTKYGSQTTLNQSVSSIVKDLKQIGKYEQQSRLYEYHYNGDIQVIHDDIQQMLGDGWFISNVTNLSDYEGKNSLWVILSRERVLTGKSKIVFVNRSKH